MQEEAYLRDSVGLAAVGELSSSRAVGGVGGDDLSNVGDVAGGVRGLGTSGEGSDSGNGELHFDGWY